MILGSSGSPRKRNFVPDLLKSLPEAISATKNPFFQNKKKTEFDFVHVFLHVFLIEY